MNWQQWRNAFDKWVDHEVTTILWLFQSLLIIPSLYLLYFLLVKPLSFLYVIGVVVGILVILGAYVVVIFCHINEQDENPSFFMVYNKYHRLLVSLLLSIVFVPGISLALSNISFISLLFGNMNKILVCLIIASVVVSVFLGFVLLEFQLGIITKTMIFCSQKHDFGSLFAPANGLMMISGFLSCGYCVLSVLNNHSGKIFSIMKLLTWIAMLQMTVLILLKMVNVANATDFWTKDLPVNLPAGWQMPPGVDTANLPLIATKESLPPKSLGELPTDWTA